MSTVAKQMMSNTLLPYVTLCKCVLLASQFKLSRVAVAGSVALFTHCQAHQLSELLNFVILVEECKREERTEFLGPK